jgi:8-oxo-dGTP diphosphatase
MLRKEYRAPLGVRSPERDRRSWRAIRSGDRTRHSLSDVSSSDDTSAAIRVVAAVIRRGDEILACRRRPDISSAGLWEFPGGKVEPGETPEAALAREIREELGIDIRVGALIDRSTTALDSGRLIDLACYDARAETPPEQSVDHDELRWLLPRDLGSLTWAAPDLPTVAILSTPPQPPEAAPNS